MSSKKSAAGKEFNFDGLLRHPSETMTNYLIRRQRIYFKAFPDGGGFDPVARSVWDSLATTSANNCTSNQMWRQADETRKMFECWQ